MSIKKFAINENDKWIDTDLTLEQVVAEFESNALPEIQKELQKHVPGVILSIGNIRNNRDYLTIEIGVEGKNAVQDSSTMGLIGSSIASCKLYVLTQGGYSKPGEEGEKAKLEKTIWTRLGLSWEMKSRGSNGGDFFTSDGKTLDWIYDFETKKIETRSR